MRIFKILALLILCLAPAAEALGAEALLESLSLEQKVGQLFIIRPDDLDPTLTLDEINDTKAPGVKELTPAMRKALRQRPAGGFVLFRKNIATPEQLRRFTRDLRDACEVPPLMAVDEEGGQIARIANAPGFNVPKFKSAQAIGRANQARQAASAIGAYLGDFGFNLNFAPVADVNTNPKNIVIGDRAFGSDPVQVSRHVGEYLKGLHERGILGCVKHFPGHGDTQADTHDGTVAVKKTWPELLRAELIPFRENFAVADAVMTAHITLENVTGDGLPATLNPAK